MDGITTSKHKMVIAEITALRWTDLNAEELTAAAWAYHYFSIQFRENLLLALSLFPDDAKLQQLAAEECDTANLSPWPGAAEPGERMNHDDFMRRILCLSGLEPSIQKVVDVAGDAYLRRARGYAELVRALSIASYEDGGLQAIFSAMLTAPHWATPTLAGFRHFLSEHIRFDSDPNQGHGALSRHLQVDDRVLPLWEDFRDLLVSAVPRLSGAPLPQVD